MSSEDMIAEVLEPLVNAHGLEHVLAGLALMCFEKAELIRHGAEDGVTAEVWDSYGKRIEKLARTFK